MRYFTLSLLALASLLGNSAPVGAATETPAPSRWELLVRRAADTGSVSVIDPSTVFHSLARVVPNDRTLPRHAEYFSTVGPQVDPADAATYFPAYVSAVSEDWAKDAQDHWVITQWIARISLDNQLQTIYRARIVEDSAGSVLDYAALPAGKPEDAAEQAMWKEQLDRWLAETPPASAAALR